MPALLATGATRTSRKRKRSRSDQPSSRSQSHRLSTREQLLLYTKDSPHSASMSALLASPELELELQLQLQPTAGDGGSNSRGPQPPINTSYPPSRACLECLRWISIDLLAGRNPLECDKSTTRPRSCTRCELLDQDCIQIPNDPKSRSLERQLQHAHDALRAGRYDVSRHGCVLQLWKALAAHIHAQSQMAEDTEEILARLRRELQDSDSEESDSEEFGPKSQQRECEAEVTEDRRDEQPEPEEMVQQARAGMGRAPGVRERGYLEPREQAVSFQEGQVEVFEDEEYQQQRTCEQSRSVQPQPATPNQSDESQAPKKPQSDSHKSTRHDSVIDNAGMAELLTEIRLMRQDRRQDHEQMVAALHANTAVMSELLALLKNRSS